MFFEECLPFFGLSQYFDQPSFLATVFDSASAFNGDISLWDVAAVADMSHSKLIRILENGLT
jgi:hypothetical protein